jgi:hypothetical protein
MMRHIPRQLTTLSVCLALLVVAFMLAAVAGLFGLGLGIAVLGAAISFISLFGSLKHEALLKKIHQAWARRKENSQKQEEAITQEEALIRKEERFNLLFPSAPMSVFLLFFIWLVCWAFVEQQRVDKPYAESIVSAIQSIGIKVNPPPPGPTGTDLSGLQNSINGLGHRLDNLSEKIGATVIQGQPPAEPRDMIGKGTIDIPLWVNFVLIGIVACSIWLIYVLGKNENLKGIKWPLITISILSGLLSGASFITIKDNKIEFRCEHCVDVNHDTAQKAIRTFGKASPSFDSGLAKFDQNIECGKPQSSKGDWSKWLSDTTVLLHDHSIFTASDTLIIVGSTDRQVLNKQHAKLYGSNEGLARARAETVKKCLIGNFQNETDPVISESNIIVLTTGPAFTPAGSSPAKREKPDPNLADDRRVKLWINAAIPDKH